MKLLAGMFRHLDRCHEQSERYAKRFFLIFVVALVLMALTAKVESGSGFILIIGIAVWLSMLLTFVFLQPNSCRCLLLCWLIGGAAFFLLVTDGLNVLAGKALGDYSNPNLDVFTFCYVAFWCYSIGIADDGAGKLAAQAVNTTTTLLTVGIGLLAANGADKYPGIPWERIHTKIITALLPLVVCGYIAALFKEAQIYWRKKYGTGKEPE